MQASGVKSAKIPIAEVTAAADEAPGPGAGRFPDRRISFFMDKEIYKKLNTGF